MSALTIGKVAEQSGVGVETVRFYERHGLIGEPPRTASGYRQFPESTVGRIRFIKRAQKLGFTLREIVVSVRPRPGPRWSQYPQPAPQRGHSRAERAPTKCANRP